MKQDYQYFTRPWKAVESDEERKRLELYHPMLRRMGSLDQWIPSVNALERNLKKFEAAGAKPSDLKTMKDEIERRKKIVLDLMSGMKNPTQVE